MLTGITIDSSDRPSRPRRGKRRRAPRKPGRKVGGSGALLWAGLVSVSLACAVVITILGVRAVTLAYRNVFPDIAVLKSAYPVPLEKVGSQIVYKFQKKRPARWVALKEVSPKAVAAILMSEDSGFFEHHGYEPDSIREAMAHNRQPGVKVMRGGSTITQQVVKNLFLSPEKTLSRKIRELLLAVELERQFPKRKILETYLNIAEWGPGVYGIGPASEHYFHKPPSELSAHDGAILAFMLPNPIKYQSSLRDGLSDFARKRVETILERLWKTGKISDEEYTSAANGVPSDL